MTANPQLWYTTSRGMYIWEVVGFFLFFSLVEKSLNIGCWMKVSIFLSLFQAKVHRWVHITVSSAVNGSGDLWNPCVVRCGAKPARRGQEIQRHQMTLPDLICVLMRDISITFTNKRHDYISKHVQDYVCQMKVSMLIEWWMIFRTLFFYITYQI